MTSLQRRQDGTVSKNGARSARAGSDKERPDGGTHLSSRSLVLQWSDFSNHDGATFHSMPPILKSLSARWRACLFPWWR
jgi:hypothetical protein